MSHWFHVCYTSRPSHPPSFNYTYEYNIWRSRLCDFIHLPVTASLLAPNILLSTLFPNTPTTCIMFFPHENGPGFKKTATTTCSFIVDTKQMCCEVNAVNMRLFYFNLTQYKYIIYFGRIFRMKVIDRNIYISPSFLTL
jgi:hypothetical protein